MAWSLIKNWMGVGNGVPSGANSITVTSTTNPAAPGATLVALVAVKPDLSATIPSVNIEDDLGGGWHQASDENGPIFAGDATSSTKYFILARLNAGGVTTVTINATGGVNPYMIAHIAEFSGGPTEGVPVWQAKSQVNPSGLTWPALTVTADANSLVLAGGSLGVTNRTLTASEPFTEAGNYKSGGLHNVGIYYAPTEPGDYGPTWTVASTASTVPTITAALVGAQTPPSLEITVSGAAETYVGVPVEVDAEAVNGSGPKTFEWVSDKPGTFANYQAPDTTFTPAESGTYTLTCTVTDSSGSASAVLTLSSVELPTLPITGALGWSTVIGAPTPLEALTDDNDSSYVESSENPVNDVLTIVLPPMQRPLGDLMVPMRLSAVGGEVSLVPELYHSDAWIPTESIVVSGTVSGYTAIWPAEAIESVVGWENGLTIRLVASV